MSRRTKNNHKIPQKFVNLKHFLADHGLKITSTPEIKAYSDFISAKRAQRGSTRVTRSLGMEKHHVVPREFFGKNHPSNYVNLTMIEHLIAHRLLKDAIKSSAALKRYEQNKSITCSYSAKRLRCTMRWMLVRQTELMPLMLEDKTKIS